MKMMVEKETRQKQKNVAKKIICAILFESTSHFAPRSRDIKSCDLTADASGLTNKYAL